MRGTRKNIAPGRVWPLVKIAGFWFIFAQGAMIVASSIDTSPVPFLYFAGWAFAIQSVIVLLRALIADGVSWRLGFSAVACLAVGIGIFSLHGRMEADSVVWPRWLFRSIDGLEEDRSRTFSSMQPADHLTAAAHLIFIKGTQKSLGEANRHLLSIPQWAAEYKSAQALLRVVQSRLDQLKIRKDEEANEKASIEIIAREQTEHGVRITLRNNGTKSVRNIRYRVSYFRVADGRYIEPDKESLIAKEIAPHGTWTFEFPDHFVEDVYRSVTVVSWDAVS